MARLRGLPLVSAADELTGVAPAAFERVLGRVTPRDAVHRGCLHLCATVTRHALALCAPPSAGRPVIHALNALDDFVAERTDARTAAKARAELFSAIAPLERATADAVRGALEHERRTPATGTALDDHADGVVVRWATLGAHFAASAALLALDAVASPREAARVPAQAAGAVAYRFVGLGKARSVELRRRALEHASWEHGRGFSLVSEAALAVQLFHEFLGAAWKDVSDAQRLQYFELMEWALPETLRGN